MLEVWRRLTARATTMSGMLIRAAARASESMGSMCLFRRLKRLRQGVHFILPVRTRAFNAQPRMVAPADTRILGRITYQMMESSIRPAWTGDMPEECDFVDRTSAWAAQVASVNVENCARG